MGSTGLHVLRLLEQKASDQRDDQPGTEQIEGIAEGEDEPASGRYGRWQRKRCDATLSGWHVYRAQLANAPTNAQYLRSSNLAITNLCITAKTIAAETPNMSAPFVASSGPSNRHDGVRSRSP